MGEGGFFALFLAMGGVGAALVLGPIGQALGRRFAGDRGDPKSGLTTGEMTAERIGELEGRLAELEASSQARIAELEERLDFTERLLAQGSGERLVLPESGQ